MGGLRCSHFRAPQRSGLGCAKKLLQLSGVGRNDEIGDEQIACVRFGMYRQYRQKSLPARSQNTPAWPSAVVLERGLALGGKEQQLARARGT
jgi:hypothetical protein